MNKFFTFTEYFTLIENYNTPEQIISYIKTLPGWRSGLSMEEIDTLVDKAGTALRIRGIFDPLTKKRVTKMLQANYGVPSHLQPTTK